MIVVTTDTVPGHRVDAVCGEVTGLTVRARSASANWTAGASYGLPAPPPGARTPLRRPSWSLALAPIC